jgi:2-methylfumaryl-CoA isomerase
MNSLLTGLRIVESVAFVAAPLGGLTLAQMGADVIRIDPIGGGLDSQRWPLSESGRSLYWAGLNKSKRSIAIDLRAPEGQALAREIITAPGDDAGILLSNFPARGWLAYDGLVERRADLIMVNIVGNRDGSTALDYTVNCAVGLPQITGEGHDNAPVNHVLPAWDISAGLSAAVAILAAERHRRASGEGQYVRLSLSDVALAMVGHLGFIAETEYGEDVRRAHGNHLFGAFGRDFETADSRRVMVVAISRRQWRNLCEATGLAEKMDMLEGVFELDFDREGDRFEAREAISSLIQNWCEKRSLSQIAECFDAAGVCWGPYQSFQQLLDEDPRCSEANPMFQKVEQPGVGTYLMPGCSADFGASPRLDVRPAPAIGQHTDEVLAELLGFSGAEIGRLHDAGLVGAP